MHRHEISSARLKIAIILNITITIAQVIGGLYASSLSLLSDALHNFSDVMALIISWSAHRISRKQSEEKRTFGYKRAEIIAALFNATVLRRTAGGYEYSLNCWGVNCYSAPQEGS